MRRMEKDNSGFSIVELIIVIAIIAAVVTTAALSVGLVFSANARTCANDIMGAIAECKIATMSAGQGNVRLLIYRDSNGDIFSELQTRESASASWTAENGAEKIGARRCLISTTNGGTEVLESGTWEIIFDRSSGSFASTTIDGVSPVWDVYVSGGSKNYLIHLEKLTGKTTKDLVTTP